MDRKRVEENRWGDDYFTLDMNARELGNMLTRRDGVEMFRNFKGLIDKAKQGTGHTPFKNQLKIWLAMWYGNIDPFVAMDMEIHHIIGFTAPDGHGPDSWWNMSLMYPTRFNDSVTIPKYFKHDWITRQDKEHGHVFTVADSWYIRQCSQNCYAFNSDRWWDAFNLLRRMYPPGLTKDVLFRLKGNGNGNGIHL